MKIKITKLYRNIRLNLKIYSMNSNDDLIKLRTRNIFLIQVKHFVYIESVIVFIQQIKLLELKKKILLIKMFYQ